MPMMSKSMNDPALFTDDGLKVRDFCELLPAPRTAAAGVGARAGTAVGFWLRLAVAAASALRHHLIDGEINGDEGLDILAAAASRGIALRAFIIRTERRRLGHRLIAVRAVHHRVEDHILRRASDRTDGRVSLRVAPEAHQVYHESHSLPVFIHYSPSAARLTLVKKAVIKHKTNIYGHGEADAVIETERLIMREITEADFEAASRILGDVGVMYAWEHGFSEEEVRRWIGECIRRYKDDGFSYLAAVEKTSGEIIGFIGPLVETIEGCRHFGVAYILMKERWGMGYATEGARASLACAFERLGAERVIAVIRPENSASRGVAERLGMEIEGRFIRHYRGKEMPHLIYAISKDRFCVKA